MLAPLLTRDASLPGRRIQPERLREYVDAILYVLRTGCPWRHSPARGGIPRINRNRRMVRQWAATLQAHAGFLILSQIAVLLGRLS